MQTKPTRSWFRGWKSKTKRASEQSLPVMARCFLVAAEAAVDGEMLVGTSAVVQETSAEETSTSQTPAHPPETSISQPSKSTATSIAQPSIFPAVEDYGQLLNNQLPNDPIPVSVSNEIDPQLIAKQENKGFSWKCAVHSVLGGWEAGMACFMLEEKYPPSAPPKSPPPPAPKPSPPPPPPAAPAPAPAPAPKKSNNGGTRGVGPMQAVPRGIGFVLG